MTKQEVQPEHDPEFIKGLNSIEWGVSSLRSQNQMMQAQWEEAVERQVQAGSSNSSQDQIKQGDSPLPQDLSGLHGNYIIDGKEEIVLIETTRLGRIVR